MVFTAVLPFEIKLHGVGLAAQMLRTYRTYTNSHPPKTSWLQTLSHAIDSKRETLHSVSYCSIAWHASQCASLLLNSYLHDFNKCPWFPERRLLWEQNDPYILPTLPAHTLPCKSHSSAGAPGSSFETLQETMVCGFCFFWPALNVNPFCISSLRCWQDLGVME